MSGTDPPVAAPLTVADRAAGFDWAFSIRQMKISETSVFDRSKRSRAWFEAAIKDRLDRGRPDKDRLVFDRQVVTRGKHPTPSRFATQVATRATHQHPHIDSRDKSSKVKACFKGQRALRG